MTLDFKAALANLDGDEVLLAELAGIFCEESPKVLATLRTAVAQKDAKAIRTAAHSLKGSVGAFRAQGALEAATKLESFAEAGELENALGASAALEAEIGDLVLALQSLGTARHAAGTTDLPSGFTE